MAARKAHGGEVALQPLRRLPALRGIGRIGRDRRDAQEGSTAITTCSRSIPWTSGRRRPSSRGWRPWRTAARSRATRPQSPWRRGRPSTTPPPSGTPRHRPDRSRSEGGGVVEGRPRRHGLCGLVARDWRPPGGACALRSRSMSSRIRSSAAMRCLRSLSGPRGPDRHGVITTDPAYAAECRKAAEWLKGDLAAMGFAASLRETGGQS
jgi:hypothetical protein